MANFLGNLGAAFRGQQDYEIFRQKQEESKVRIEAERARLAEIKDLAAEAKKQRDRQPEVDQATLDFLSSLGGGGAQGIPPPPAQQPQGAAPPVQPPAPGQQSVPMVQPTAQYGQRPIGPPPPQMQQRPPMPQGGPPMPQQGQPMPPQGPQGAPQGQPPMPPYKTVAGGPQGGPQQQPQGIPAPPQQPQGAPPPNSMTLQDAAKFIKARNITDPQAAIQILDKLTPYLNNEAKQQAKQLEMQLDQQKAMFAQQQKKDELEEKKREADMRSEDRKLSLEDRKAARSESNAIKNLMVGIAKQNADSRSTAAGTKAGGGPAGDNTAVEAAAWNSLLKNEQPPRTGGMYNKVMAEYGKIAKDAGMSVQELVSASADVKSKLAAKKSFETRAQNMERAENQILAEIPIMRDAMKSLDLPNIPVFAKGGIAALRQLGDPRVTTLDQAAETVFNEFQGIITGNPGTLNVSDVQQARHNYESARTPKQMEAALAGMDRIMHNAKAAMAKTRKDIMSDINNSMSAPKAAKAPAVGTVDNGYKFKGGDPGVASNWEKQ
jgi:hypothetical protein